MRLSPHAAPQYPDACHADLAGDSLLAPAFSHRGNVHAALAGSRARITVVTIDMVHLNLVVMLEEQSTTATAPVLLFEQPGQSCTDVGVSALSRAPVHPVPIIGTAVAFDLHMPCYGHLAVGQQVHGIGVSGRGGKGETGATRCQYRWRAQAVDFLGCRQCAQWRSLTR